MEKDKELGTEKEFQKELPAETPNETPADSPNELPTEEKTEVKTDASKEKGIERLKKRRKFKRIRFFIILGVLLIAILTSIIALSSKKGEVTITIPAGASSRQIAEILKKNDIIESKYLFLVNLKFSEYNGKLHFGTFRLDKGDSYKEIIEKLATSVAKKKTVTITIPEGYSVEQIKATIVSMGLCTEKDFEEALNKDYDYPFLKSVPKDEGIKYRIQGYLYPSTYEIFTDATAEDIIRTMLDEFQKQTQGLKIKDYNETITLASLVEREAKLDSERHLISGVMHNRTEVGMALQIDATVVYAISDGKYDVTRVYYKDLEIDSPYNTYKYPGLPAGPICSPSIKSIKAAISPAEHNFFYYHTDTEKNDGSHIFTETYSEHTSTMK